MPRGDNRRRNRRCPSCGGANIMRGTKVDGVTVSLVRDTEDSPAVKVPAFSDICGECGLVSLYVRVGEGQEQRI